MYCYIVSYHVVYISAFDPGSNPVPHTALRRSLALALALSPPSPHKDPLLPRKRFSRMASLWMLAVLAAAAFVLLLLPGGAVCEGDTTTKKEQTRDGDRNVADIDTALDHQLAHQLASRPKIRWSRKMLDSPAQFADHPATSKSQAAPEAQAKVARTVKERDAAGSAVPSTSSSTKSSSKHDNTEDLFHIDYTPAAIHPPRSHGHNP
ncbi:uncharacterized protein LOC9640697 [Selaginella moellendorffii]|nr:uncharacterized protein LOC9640697 [Selaginella moellendorffii]|eukprot:XP_002971853.2 uncharacterized protein LOC9640697 [Selaginella moellendorffii]